VSPLRRLSAFAVALATSALLVLGLAAPASAHDTLVASDPADGSTVETLPAELTLTYSAELIDAGTGTAVAVTSPSGADVTAGSPTVSGAVVTVPLAEPAEAGAYTVTWRVVSSDGHPVDGTYAFTVTAPSTPIPSAEPTRTPDVTATPSPSDTASETPVPAESEDPTDGAATDGTPADGGSFLRNLPWIVGGILLAAALGAFVAVLLARARRGTRDGSDGDETDRGPRA